MAKFHIGKDGIPGECHAVKGKCPYGEKTEHYNTFAEAAKVSQQNLEKEYGVFREITDDEKAEIKVIEGSQTYFQSQYVDAGGQKTFTQYISSELNNGGGKRANAGLDSEVYGAVSYAENDGCNNTIIINNEGEMIVDSSSEESYNKAQEVYEDAVSRLSERMEQDGLTVKDPSKLVKVLHYSDDGKTMVAQMGGSNVLDIARMNDEGTEVIEFKNMQGGGAQTASTKIKVNADGSFNTNIDGLDDNMKTQLAKLNMKDSVGTNPSVNLTNSEALGYVVESYKAKGANKLSYIGTNDRVNEIDLNGDTQSIVNRMESEGLVATVNVRTNTTTKKPTKTDLKRWKEKRGSYFKDGTFPEESFKLKDIKQSVMKESNKRYDGTRARIGEIYLPKGFTRKSIQDMDPETEIKVSDLRAASPELIGVIKQPKSKK